MKINFQHTTPFHDIRSGIEYLQYEHKDGVWFVLKNVNKSMEMALVDAEYNECVSNTIKIQLQAYFPTQTILDRAVDFLRGWRTAVGVIQLKHGFYEEHYVPLNIPPAELEMSFPMLNKILSYTYPPSHLNMTRPPKPYHVASGYEFHIGCQAFDFTDFCSIDWSTDENCSNIIYTT
ncbi:hypothetical protein DPMN_102128 [Dreissena polymorpha]|uniref:Uncharacterized protein n=1 Tax=Dreissena polymorpha TaxID=45954 RepID=A0A9D4R9P4_DREPO|nr:hypothetical protein DPMN_102128 [Dreissena polymorpha]